MEDESTDSGRDNRSRTVASNPGWDDDGLLEEIVGGSVVASVVGAVQLPTPHRAVDLLLALHMSLLLLEEGFQLARLVLSLLQATTLMTLLGAPVG